MGELDVYIHVFVTTLAGGKWSASRPGPLYPQGKSPGTRRIGGGWVGPRTGLDDVEMRKFLTLSGL
jgi:hypothetical protein